MKFLSINFKEDIELLAFLDNDGKKCARKDASIAIGKVLGKDNGFSVPVSLSIVDKLKLEEGDIFHHDEKYHTFDRLRNKFNYPELEKRIHQERKEFEEWFSSNWDADYTICFINEEQYGYNMNAVEMAWQTWKHLRMEV